MKVVIPAAGLGTRFLPATKSMPKEMLPVLNRPVIQYVVEEAVAAGADDITIITGRSKRALEDHFDRNPELAGSSDLPVLRQLDELSEKAQIHFVRQRSPHGLADALLCAEKHIGSHSFGVLLGDSIHLCDPPLLRQLQDVFEKMGGRSSVLALEVVPDEKVSSYGIAAGPEVAERTIDVQQLVEKPRLEEAPARTAITGAYYLTPTVFEAIRGTPPDRRGEIQLTDSLVHLMSREKIYGLVFKGRRYDTGTPELWLEANVRFALADPKYRDRLHQVIGDASTPQ